MATAPARTPRPPQDPDPAPPGGTSTTAGARAHARAQHGRTTPHMRHVPATHAPDLPGRTPEGLDPADLTWAETLAPGGHTGITLARGTRVRLFDPHGHACAHLMLVRADATHERLNTADTVKVPWQAYLGAGHPLLSSHGRVLATVVADTGGHHDALTGTTSGPEPGTGDGAASGRALLTLAALEHGLTARDLPPTVSFFQGVRVDPDGALIHTGSAGPGHSTDLLLHTDTILLAAGTAHPLDPDPRCTALDIRAWRAPDDLARLLDGRLLGPLPPEHRTAADNTEADLHARGTR
ncbi:DUF1989 domain-containing protein [Nocardiopsis sp. HNM0947]|uniref:DUF1989 domain-containing protein n=1 Tax=Nocardiopsis coralli TaxID=2772213 RepID=A0ABR9P9N8_9ACTN|nr:urea amidolyase associated protein UAAP1 [Nocardiopsis coralli]MBE3000558.1 DUF1989 domain-containing protein [Nocardiopsis coralli]